MFKKMFVWLKNLAGETSADIAGGMLGYVLVILFGKKKDGKTEVIGLIQQMREAFKGEFSQDAVRYFRKVKPEVRRAVENIYRTMGPMARESFEQTLGKFLEACQNEVTGTPRGVKEYLKNLSEGDEPDLTKIRLRYDHNQRGRLFVAFWNSFLDKKTGKVDEEEIELYLDMLNQSSIFNRVASVARDGWDQVRQSDLWERALWYIYAYGMILGALIIMTVMFVLSSLFLAVETYQWTSVAFFTATSILLALSYVLSYPVGEVLDEIHQLLQEGEDEGNWEKRKKLVRRRIGELAFLMLVLFLVPFGEHPEYLPVLIMAVVVTAMLEVGWRQQLGQVVIVVVTLIALWPSITTHYRTVESFWQNEVQPRFEATVEYWKPAPSPQSVTPTVETAKTSPALGSNEEIVTAPVGEWSDPIATYREVVINPVVHCVDFKWYNGTTWSNVYELCPEEPLWETEDGPKRPHRVGAVAFRSKREVPTEVFLKWSYR